MEVTIHPVETDKYSLTNTKFKVLPEAKKVLIAPKDRETGSWICMSELTEEEKDYIAEILFIKHVPKELHDKVLTKIARVEMYLEYFQFILADKEKVLNISSNIEHMIQYKIIKSHSLIASDKASVHPRIHYYYFKNEEAEATKKIDSKRVILKAHGIIEGCSDAERRNLCYLLEIPVNGMSLASMTAALYDYTESVSKANKLIKTHEDKDKNDKVVLRAAIASGIIGKTSGGLTYTNALGHSKIVGDTFDEAFAYFSKEGNEQEAVHLMAKVEAKGLIATSIALPKKKGTRNDNPRNEHSV